MEREEIIDSIETNLIIHIPSVTIKDRIKEFFNLPKPIHEELDDNEQCVWCMLINNRKINKKFFFCFYIIASNILLCANSFFLKMLLIINQ